MSAYEMAKRYYPNKWNETMLRHLVEIGRLTTEQFEEITGKTYD